MGLWLAAASALGAQIQGTRPAITGISHVIVLNDDLDASGKFYAGFLGWPASPALEEGDAVHYQVGTDQFVEVKKSPGAKDPVDRLDHIAFKTSDVEAMLRYLGANGVAVPASVSTHPNGSRSFLVTDPEGYRIEFVQGGNFPPPAAAGAVSTHLMHIGFNVRDESAESHFYKDILGFRLYWEGWNKDDGHKDGVYDYKSLQVPDGTDWIEFMLQGGRNVAPGAPWPSNPHHFAPGVVSVDDAYALLLTRGLADRNEPRSKPLLGRNGKMQLNLFDLDGLRVELMNFKPSKEPCCAPYTGPQPEPSK
jgi:catechol 2,3-dioxygenase-like lactoylglutathione lyase family enzyme